MVRVTANSGTKILPTNYMGEEHELKPQAERVGDRANQQSSLSPNLRRTRTSSASQGDGTPRTSMEKRHNGGEDSFNVRVSSKIFDRESEATMVLQDDGSWISRADCLRRQSTGRQVGGGTGALQTDCEKLRNSRDYDEINEDEVSMVLQRDGTWKPVLEKELEISKKSNTIHSVRSSGRRDSGQVCADNGLGEAGLSREDFAKVGSALSKANQEDEQSEVTYTMQNDGSWKRFSECQPLPQSSRNSGDIQQVEHLSQSLRSSRASQRSGTQGHEEDRGLQPMSQSLRSSRASQRSGTQGYEEDRGLQPVSQSLRSSRASQRSGTQGYEKDGDLQPMSQSLRSSRAGQRPCTQGHDNDVDLQQMSQSMRSSRTELCDRMPQSLKSSRDSQQSCTQGHEDYGDVQRISQSQSLKNSRASLRSCTQGLEEDVEMDILQPGGTFKPISRVQPLSQSLRSSKASHQSCNEGSDEDGPLEILHPEGTFEPVSQVEQLSPSVRSNRSCQRSCSQSCEQDGDLQPTSRSLKSSRASRQSRTQGHEEDGDLQPLSQSLRGSQASQPKCTPGRVKDWEIDEAMMGYGMQPLCSTGRMWDDGKIDFCGPKGSFLQSRFLELEPSRYLGPSTRHSSPYPLLIKLRGVKLEGDPKVMKALSAEGLYALDDGNLVNSRPVYRHRERPSLVLGFSGQAWFVQPDRHVGRAKGCMCLVDTSHSPDKAKSKTWWVFDNDSFVEQPSVSCSEFMDFDVEQELFPQYYVQRKREIAEVKLKQELADVEAKRKEEIADADEYRGAFVEEVE